MINLNKKTIFCHNEKTAGTSMSMELRQLRGNYYIASNLRESGDGKIEFNEFTWETGIHYPNMHTRMRTYNKIVNLSDFYSFAFVRNPFEVIVSAWDSNKYENFDRYVEHEIFTGLQICARRSQYEYLTDNGTLLVDFVGRYENLSSDFYEVINEIKVPLMMLPKRNIGKEKRSQDYKKYFTPLSRKTVERKFEKDLNFFNYEF